MSAPQPILDALKALQDYLQGVVVVRPAPPEPPDTAAPPYCVPMTLMTIFGLEWDGEKFDPGDNGRGAWGLNTRNPEVIGCALPMALIRDTFGGLESDKIKGYTVEVYSQVTQKTVKLVDIVDEGPAAWTHRGIDGTYGLHKAIGHIEYGLANYGSNYSKWPAGFHVSYWINDPSGKSIEIKGWDFSKKRVTGS